MGADVRLGLIGCGIWGERILRALSDLSVPVAACDIDASRERRALEFGAISFVSQLDALPAVDGYIIATPASTHADVVAKLDELGNQAPLFVEKPLTDTLADARLLLQRTGAPIFVMHIWTYHPGIRKLKRLLESGAVGAPTLLRSTRANWTSPRRDIDTLGNLAPHDLSIFHFLLGSLPRPVYANAEFMSGSLVGCVACLQDPNGPPCILEVSNRYGEKRREVRVHGETGVLVLPDDEGGYINLIRGEGFIVPNQVETIDFSGLSALDTELRAFLEFLEGDRKAPLWDVGVGAEVVQAIHEIRALAMEQKDSQDKRGEK